MFPRMSPIASSLTPATQSGILEILQREQDHAVALLSSSPLLASLFVSYANQASAFESATPSTESEDWKALEDTISKLQEEINALKPENLEMKGKLEAAAASQEAFRSQISALKEVSTTQQDDIKSLRAELLKTKGFLVSSNAEKVALQAQITNLGVCPADSYGENQLR
jgi:FtsZ-binding cell division protein ZapB